MKNYLGTYILFLLLLFFHKPRAQDIINWEPDYLLTWNDFQGIAPDNTYNIRAISSLEIHYSLNVTGSIVTYHVFCSFDKSLSWTKSQANNLLVHERGHFNIAELFARKLFKSFKNYKINKSNIYSDFEKIYDSITNQYDAFSALYDKETNYSRNIEKQNYWNNKILTEIKKLDTFSKKTFISIVPQ